MAYLWDQLDFLVGGRFTSLSYMRLHQWPTAIDAEILLLGQFIWLPKGQHVDLEEDFLGSHLPYRRAMVGGLDSVDDPWMLAIQAVPTSVVHDLWGSEADPYDVMREAHSLRIPVDERRPCRHLHRTRRRPQPRLSVDDVPTPARIARRNLQCRHGGRRRWIPRLCVRAPSTCVPARCLRRCVQCLGGTTAHLTAVDRQLKICSIAAAR
jgi:hypothetical protein